MWAVVATKEAAKAIAKLPPPVSDKYALWFAIVTQSGPLGLRSFKSFHDEALAGRLKGLRSSRLNLQWRVIYRVEASVVTVRVERVTAHDYRE